MNLRHLSLTPRRFPADTVLSGASNRCYQEGWPRLSGDQTGTTSRLEVGAAPKRQGCPGGLNRWCPGYSGRAGSIVTDIQARRAGALENPWSPYTGEAVVGSSLLASLWEMGLGLSTTGRLCAKCCQRQVSKPHGEASNKCKALVSAGIGDRDTNEGFFSCLPPLRKQSLLGGGEGGLIEYTIPCLGSRA